MKYFFVFSIILSLVWPFSINANIINEYMVNLMLMIGSTTRCSEVTRNPILAKESVLGIVSSINKFSPDNPIDSSYVTEKFDSVVVYCAANPDDLLVVAIGKVFGVNGPATNNPPMPNNNLNSAAPKAQPFNGVEASNKNPIILDSQTTPFVNSPTKNNAPIKKSDPNSEVEFIN